MALLTRWAPPALALSLPLGGAPEARRELPRMSEAQARATMVYNFASFTEWPEAPPRDRPFVIGVLGNQGIAAALQALGKLGDGREIEIRNLSDSESLGECRLLYISAISDRAVAAALARIATLPVLTIGEQEHFIELGGIIRVYREGNRLRFEVDVTRAAGVLLKISSRVLNLARLVKDTDASNP